ncbi:MAG: Holliday junction resolvase-like protein [Nanoarchaeota archaeon]
MDTTILVLFVVAGIILFLIGFVAGRLLTAAQKELSFRMRLPGIRKDAIAQSRSVLTGKFSEQLAPFLPDFPFKATEARFVGSPIDFIVFEGMDDKSIDKIHLVEVKSGQAQMSRLQRMIQKAVTEGRIAFTQYRIPEKLTENKKV